MDGCIGSGVTDFSVGDRVMGAFYPLHNVVVETFEFAGHGRRRFDFNGTFGCVPVCDWGAERHHHGVGHTHHLARRR
jgi:hypothetical protein